MATSDGIFVSKQSKIIFKGIIFPGFEIYGGPRATNPLILRLSFFALHCSAIKDEREV